MRTSFYNQDEIGCMGLKSIGTNVLISRKTSVYNPGVIEIGDNVRIDDFCVLSGGSGIRLGSFIHIACFVALYGGAGIVIEDFSGLSARVTIYSQNDDYSGMSLTGPMIPAHLKPLYHGAPVALRRHVIVGANTTILPGVDIGEGVAIGAHSLVTRDCEEWWIYSGVPAKRYKQRSKKLLDLEKRFLDEICPK
jgi:galactoside O-acetyltransferase